MSNRSATAKDEFPEAYAAPRGFVQQQEKTLERPEFEVHPLDGTYTRHIREYVREKDEDTGRISFRLVEEQVQEAAGYIVFFARGHSIHVKDDKELARLGLNRQPGVINLKTHERVGANVVPTLKELAGAQALSKHPGERAGPTVASEE